MTRKHIPGIRTRSRSTNCIASHTKASSSPNKSIIRVKVSKKKSPSRVKPDSKNAQSSKRIQSETKKQINKTPKKSTIKKSKEHNTPTKPVLLESKHIHTPKVTKLKAKLKRKALDDSSSCEEDISDAHFAFTHKPYEMEEQRIRKSEAKTLVKWAVCDDTNCLKWRIVAKQIGKNEAFYCGGGVRKNSIACIKLDDWIVKCVGVTCAQQLAAKGIRTVEGLDNNTQLLKILTKEGCFYESESMKIVQLNY